MIGFDACLMATYETASTLQTLADRMVASQELEPGYGWDYTALETAARGGSVDDVAASILKAYDEQSLSEGESQVTLSEIDLTKMRGGRRGRSTRSPRRVGPTSTTLGSDDRPRAVEQPRRSARRPTTTST